MQIQIPHRKNDQYNVGHNVHIVRTFTDTCPVTITARYLEVLPNKLEQSLVCRLSYTRHGHKAQIHPISYSCVREILLATLKTVSPDISGYGTHSLKRGDVSTAMNSITTDQIDLHAGWKCPSSKKLYQCTRLYLVMYCTSLRFIV